MCSEGLLVVTFVGRDPQDDMLLVAKELSCSPI